MFLSFHLCQSCNTDDMTMFPGRYEKNPHSGKVVRYDISLIMTNICVNRIIIGGKCCNKNAPPKRGKDTTPPIGAGEVKVLAQ